MKLGFIGTGTIAAAMIDGILQSQLHIESITISPRNSQLAEALEKKYLQVKIGNDNQAVVDASHKVFICLRSQDAKDILTSLKFRSDQLIISTAAMAQQKDIAQWTGNVAPIFRAVPLPFVKTNQGVTPFFPPHDFLKMFFDALGGSIALDNEEQLTVFMVAGSMMGSYFRFIAGCNDWLKSEGIATQQSSAYLSAMFGSLADVMRQTQSPDFTKLQHEYSTKNGTNEMLAKLFEHEGGIQALTTAIQQTSTKVIQRDD